MDTRDSTLLSLRLAFMDSVNRLLSIRDKGGRGTPREADAMVKRDEAKAVYVAYLESRNVQPKQMELGI